MARTKITVFPKRQARVSGRKRFRSVSLRRHGELMKSKLYGLKRLRSICRRNGVRFFEYKVVKKPEEFHLKDLVPYKDRVVVRADVKTPNNWITLREWFVEREQFDVKREGGPKRAEERTKAWMKRIQRIGIYRRGKKMPLFFIVHGARRLESYHLMGQINVDFTKREFELRLNDATHETLRISPEIKTLRFKFNARGKVIESRKLREWLASLPVKQRQNMEKMYYKAMKAVRVLLENPERFKCLETSFVTYKDSPSEPEFYDLLYNKGKKDTNIID